MKGWTGVVLLGFCLILVSCADRKLSSSVISIPKYFDWQGHRGCRGLMPENSIAGFLEALKFPVTTLELDVVVSADGELIVSHDPWMSPDICTGPVESAREGVPDKRENVYTMTVDEIQNYDCGGRGNPKFPRQRAMKTYKPTLAEVVTAVDTYCAESRRSLPGFNIEIKSKESWYGIYVPEPEIFVERLLEELVRLNIGERTTIQSFDLNVLRILPKHKWEAGKISYLVDKTLSIRNGIKRLGFTPGIYSPNYRLVGEKTMSYAHKHGIKVIPWTVNTVEQFNRLIKLGVDGIITDYPDLIGILEN